MEAPAGLARWRKGTASRSGDNRENMRRKHRALLRNTAGIHRQKFLRRRGFFTNRSFDVNHEVVEFRVIDAFGEFVFSAVVFPIGAAA